MEKINLVELLKDCPKDMELYSPMFGTVYFEGIKDTGIAILVEVTTSCNSIHQFYSDGKYNTYYSDSECLLFPSKDQRDWSKFQRPFKDGDVVFYNDTIAIFKEWGDETLFRTYVVKYLCCDSFVDIKVPLFGKSVRKEIRFATEEEKQKLFDAIKDYGYRWDDETKTLEKLSQFKDGDIVTYKYENGLVSMILNKFVNFVEVHYHCALYDNAKGFVTNNYIVGEPKYTHLATEEEKEKLFNAIKANGYKWNNEKMSLEKANHFYAGEVLISSAGNVVLFSHVDDKGIIYYHCILNPLGGFRIQETPDCGVGKISNCTLVSEEQRNKLFNRLKKSGYKYNPLTNKLEKLQKFKIGDRIKHKTDRWSANRTIKSYNKDIGYFTTMNDWVRIEDQDNWELVPNKFDITTLKTFDKVLVRCSDNGYWQPQFFSKFRSKSEFPFECTYNSWRQCIPYEGNEHLSDTTNDCAEYYKTW